MVATAKPFRSAGVIGVLLYFSFMLTEKLLLLPANSTEL